MPENRTVTFQKLTHPTIEQSNRRSPRKIKFGIAACYQRRLAPRSQRLLRSILLLYLISSTSSPHRYVYPLSKIPLDCSLTLSTFCHLSGFPPLVFNFYPALKWIFLISCYSTPQRFYYRYYGGCFSTIPWRIVGYIRDLMSTVARQ